MDSRYETDVGSPPPNMLSRGVGITSLRDALAEWSLQFERLGLSNF
jgi:hypothetical protein